MCQRSAVRMRPPIVKFRARCAAAGSLRVYRRDSAPWPYHAARMHGHRFFVVNYYDRGHGAVRFPGATATVAAGQVLLTAPGQLHDTSGIAHMGGWVVEFTMELVGALSPGRALVLPRAYGVPWLAFAGVRLDKPARAEVPSRDRPAWIQRFQRLEREARGDEFGAREATRALMHILIIDLARLLVPTGRLPEATAAPLVAEVLAVIDERYATPALSLAAIARAVGRSSSHVTAVVRAGTGMTVLEWLTERRMADVRRRLLETDEDIGIVAERAGLLHPAYFARLFRRIHGMSPRSYRRAHRG